MIRCPSCKNAYTGPFICVTCGAQKLYDATLRTAERRAEKAERDLAAAQKDAERYRNALERISKWFGEFPPATSHDGTPCSYGSAFGSNGERDFMRKIAKVALDAAMEKAK